jgi:hypothetical protein
MAGQLGAKGLFTGLGPRIVMVATLTAGQFAIYGDVRTHFFELCCVSWLFINLLHYLDQACPRCHRWCRDRPYPQGLDVTSKLIDAEIFKLRYTYIKNLAYYYSILSKMKLIG